MSSQPQIEANRRNSKKSTGPRTAAGKLASSRNAVKTGIYSEAEVIRDENPAELAGLAAGYHARFLPEGPAERCLVDILVHSEWMLRRFRRAEAQLWEKNIEDSSDIIEPDQFDLGRAVNYNEGRVYGRLQRRIDSTQRNYHRALNDLNRLQANRPVPQPVPAVQPAAAIGFVPSPPPEPHPQPAVSPSRIHIRVNPCPSVAAYPGPEPRTPSAPTCYTGTSSPDIKQIA